MITTEQFSVTEIVHLTVPRVFDTMLALPVVLLKAGPLAHGERVCGSLGIGGDQVSAAVFVNFPAALAARAAVAMLGSAATSVSYVNDVVSELTNMIGGTIKSALCDAGRPCAMSTPSVIRGLAFTVELSPDVVSHRFLFRCEGEILAVEVQLKIE